jgi:hypothetical protein
MNKARFLVLGIAALGLTTVLHSTLAYAVVLDDTSSETTSESAPRHAIVTVKPSHSVAPGTGALSSGIVTVPPPKASTSATPAHGPVTSGIVTVPQKSSTVTPPVASSAAIHIPDQQAAAAAMKAAASAPPPPASPHAFKHGECPLTRDSSGTWRGPDGVEVDAATANMGDCKTHSK